MYSTEDEKASPDGNDHADINGRVVIKPRAPMDTAETFYDRRAWMAGKSLIRYRNTWYVWTGTKYRKLDAEEVRTELWQFLSEAVAWEKETETTKDEDGQTQTSVKMVKRRFRPEPNDVSKLSDALMHYPELRVPGEVSAPAWLPGTHPAVVGAKTHSPGDLRACSNGLVDIITGEKFLHTPYFLTMNSVDYLYDPEAERPRFEKFLDEVWPGSSTQRPDDFDDWSDEQKDPQLRRELVQEIFGYLLSSDARKQKLFLFTGKPRSGKGTLARVLKGLVGEDNVIGFALDSLDNEFGLEDLIDKQVAIVGDARLDGKSHKAVTRLLSISGEDKITINRKHEKKWLGTLGVRFLILTNPLLNFTDASGVIATRFIPVVFSESFEGRENENLTAELLTELPGILNWAIEGLKRLRARGHFVLPPSSLDVIVKLKRKAAPVLNFIDDECELGPNYQIKRDDLYPIYQGWCETNGHHPMSKTAFVSALEDADPSIKCKRPRTEADEDDEKRPFILYGIKRRGAPAKVQTLREVA
jgi:putative DNA primase/helicase